MRKPTLALPSSSPDSSVQFTTDWSVINVGPPVHLTSVVSACVNPASAYRSHGLRRAWVKRHEGRQPGRAGVTGLARTARRSIDSAAAAAEVACPASSPSVCTHPSSPPANWTMHVAAVKPSSRRRRAGKEGSWSCK